MQIKMKWSIAIIIIISMFFIPMVTLATTEDAIDVSTKEEFLEAVTTTVKNINVINDIDLTYANVVDVSGRIINLNGHRITAKNFTLIFQGSNFKIHNGIFDADGGAYALFIGDEGTTNNVTIENITTIGGVNIYNATNVTLVNVEATGAKYYAIWCDEGGQATIKSGTFTTKGGAVLGLVNNTAYDSVLKIEGGKFITNGKPLVYKKEDEYGKPEISGGSFDAPIDLEYCAEGFEPIKGEDDTYSTCNHSNTIVKNVKKPSCIVDGYTGDLYCANCNKLIQYGSKVSAKGHEIIYHEAIPATCTENGVSQYWSCKVCNKNFSDETGTQELEQIDSILALGHIPSEEWKFNKEYHWKECSIENCGVVIEESKQAHIEDEEGICKVCGNKKEISNIPEEEIPVDPKPETDEGNTTPTTKKEPMDHKKDDTPKTNAVENIYFVLPIAIISIVGIIVKKREINNED